MEVKAGEVNAKPVTPDGDASSVKGHIVISKVKARKFNTMGGCSNDCCTGAGPVKSSRCSTCQTCYYCNRECQRADWVAKHKLLCPQLTAYQQGTISAINSWLATQDSNGGIAPPGGKIIGPWYRTLAQLILFAKQSSDLEAAFAKREVWWELWLPFEVNTTDTAADITARADQLLRGELVTITDRSGSPLTHKRLIVNAYHTDQAKHLAKLWPNKHYVTSLDESHKTSELACMPCTTGRSQMEPWFVKVLSDKFNYPSVCIIVRAVGVLHLPSELLERWGGGMFARSVGGIITWSS